MLYGGLWLQLSEGMLHDQVISQMFAGHETTASALTRLLQYLKASPHVLGMLRAEQDELAAQHGPQLTGNLECVVTSFCFANLMSCQHLRLVLHQTVTLL